MVAAMTLRLSFVAGIVFAAAAFFIPGALMRIFTPNAELIAYGSQYLRFIAPSFLFMAFTNIYLTLLRSLGRVRAIRLHIADFFSRHRLLAKDFTQYALPTILNELFWGWPLPPIRSSSATSAPRLPRPVRWGR